MTEWQFHLTSGALCLDLANTVSWRRGPAPIERLPRYRDLVAWSLQSRLVGEAEASRVLAAAARQPRRAARALASAIALRALVDHIFNDIVDGQRARSGDLDALNAHLGRALGRMRVVPAGSGYGWDDGAAGLDCMLPPVVRSAAELLTSPSLTNLRRCGAANCGWLFIDTSRNHLRRWCDMRVCGNRAKARRHHEREREAGGSPGRA